MRGLAAGTVSVNKWPLTGISNQPGEREREMEEEEGGDDRSERRMEEKKGWQKGKFSSVHT